LSAQEIATLAAGGTVLGAFPAAPSAPEVVFSPPGGTTLVPGQTVTLSSSPPGLEIRYTLDGTEPDADSPLYTAPIVPVASVEITAAAFDDGGAGPSVRASYTVLPDLVPAGASLLLVSVEK